MSSTPQDTSIRVPLMPPQATLKAFVLHFFVALMALLVFGYAAYLFCWWLQPVDFGGWLRPSVEYSLYAALPHNFPRNVYEYLQFSIRLLSYWAIIAVGLSLWIGWMRRHIPSVRAKHFRLPGLIVLAAVLVAILSTFALMMITGESALSFASGKGFMQRSRILLWLGADPYVPGLGSNAPFCKAIYSGHEEIALFFLSAKPPSKQEAGEMLLGAACGPPELSSAYTDIMKSLLNHGADPNYSYRKVGLKPFLITSGRGNIEFMRLLLARGAIAGASDSNGQSALHFAARSCNSKSI